MVSDERHRRLWMPMASYLLASLLVLMPAPLPAMAANAAPFSCTNWARAQADVVAGEALETRGNTRGHHVAAVARYKAAVAACADYPWAWSDLQQSYGHLRQFSVAIGDGWRAIETARRTRTRWAWSAREYRAFLAGCFDNLGWVAQMLASKEGPRGRGYRAQLLAAQEYYDDALFYDAHDVYAAHHEREVRHYLTVLGSPAP